MKTKMLKLLGIILLGTNIAFAQAKTEKVEVAGQCGMCKTRIEKAAQSVSGVNTAVWNIRTKILEVSFDESKTSLKQIEKTIAALGHDTPLYKAKDEVYKKLPKCCQYKRKELGKKE